MLTYSVKVKAIPHILIYCISNLFFLNSAQADIDSPANDVAKQTQQNTIPYVLTISGGVSLGAYEAGLNWALVNYFKAEKRRADSRDNSTTTQVTPRLSTVTGASAGSINGLLTAISWCVDDSQINESTVYQGTVTNNLFKEIWVNVGLDGLLPTEAESYQTTDGLLSRSPFDIPLNKIRSIFNEKIFQANCSIPLGVTVTGEAPRTIQISGITVNNQRHFIPVTLKTDAAQQASFYSKPVDENNTNYGNVIYLPPEETVTAVDSLEYKVNLENVIQSVLASSAFPIAFGRVHLDYCNPGQRSDKQATNEENIKHSCPKPYKAESGIFVDGGVFDNVPLGSAMSLAEENVRGSQRRLNYIFMDPDNRRELQNGTSDSSGTNRLPTAVKSPSITYNLLGQIQFLGGAVLTARNYELYKVLTSGDWSNQTFYHANRISQRIEKYANENNLQLTTPDSIDCQNFFNTAHVVPVKHLSGEWLGIARHCITQASKQLDYDYQYTAETFPSLAKKRDTLAEQLELVAAALKNEHLLRQIQRIKHDPLGDRRILLSSRFYPITGSYLGAFGAFFDRPFREFDYYVGVYDGIMDIVSYACQFRLKNSTDIQCQEGILAQQLYTAMNIASDANARYIFASIGRIEHPHFIDSNDTWHWLNEIKTEGVNKQIELIFAALNKGHNEKDILEPPEFEEFIAYLKQHEYTTEDSSDYFKYIAEKDKDWWVLPALRSSDRLYELETKAEEDSEKKSLLRKPLGLVSQIAHFLDNGGKVVTFAQPSTALPNSFWRFLPYEIGVRANHEGTPYLAWEPTLNIFGKELLHFKINPAQKASTQAHSGTLYQVSTIFNLFDHPLFTAGAALDINGSWQEREGYDRVTAGLSVNAEIKKKLRITFGVYDLYDHFAEYNFYLNVGVTDIAGYFK